jgi:hypothetical protein
MSTTVENIKLLGIPCPSPTERVNPQTLVRPLNSELAEPTLENEASLARETW